MGRLKRRRSGEMTSLLTVDDIPAIVKAVVDSLPGVSYSKNLNDSSDDDDDVLLVPKGIYIIY